MRLSSQRSMRIHTAFSSVSGSGRIVGTGDGMREPSYWPSCTTGHARFALSGATVTVLFSLGVREADRLAADRVVLPQRVPVPVVLHDQPLQVRMALELD